MTTYPPERHLLRDLQLTFDHSSASTSRAWMPVVPEICGADGAVRAGVLTTLVDVIGGGLAATAAHPNWIATADLTLHLTAAATSGEVEARAHLLRAGRTTLVLEVTLHNNGATGDNQPTGDGRPIGIATMSFAVLPRRDTNPDVTEVRPEGPSTMALESSALAGPLLELVGIEVVDAAAGVVELPVREWAMNSMGALQGGIVGAVVEAAAEVALQSATGRPVVVTDVQLTYLAFGKVGPLRTRVDVIERTATHAVARVELVDAGVGGRQLALARAVATRSLA
jgi:uncharacterized protein (TIGR00369 family)